MASFTTYNQFDPKFKLSEFGGECNACPVFALFTAKKFMDNGSVSQEQHEKNLEAAVMNYVVNEDTKELPKYLSFNELLQFTGGTFSDNNIGAATPEVVNGFGYEMFFKPLEDQEGNYCTVFLKNSNYIVVLVKVNADGSKLFCVRDCHEKDQFNYDSFDALTVHLSERYQFNQLTVVDGVLIEEYGNIEFLLMDKPFPILILNLTLYDDEGKVEKDDDDMEMFIDVSDFSQKELEEMGIATQISESSLQQKIMNAITTASNPTVPSASSSSSSNEISLDEMMAMQLQYGEDY